MRAETTEPIRFPDAYRVLPAIAPEATYVGVSWSNGVMQLRIDAPAESHERVRAAIEAEVNARGGTLTWQNRHSR